MDEPFGALDEITRENLNLELLRLWRETGKTVVFVTHSISEAVFLSSRVVVMTARPGKIEGIVNIDLPQPRDDTSREDPRFFEYATQIRELAAAGAQLEKGVWLVACGLWGQHVRCAHHPLCFAALRVPPGEGGSKSKRSGFLLLPLEGNESRKRRGWDSQSFAEEGVK